MARRNYYLLFAAFVLAALPINTAGAAVWDDTFNGTVIDTLTWEVSAPLGDSKVIQKNELLLTSDGTGGEFCNTPEPLGPGAGIALRKRLAGDFDIQVDYRNFSAPFSGLTQAFLNVYQDPSNKLHIKRQHDSDGDSIQTIPVVNGVWLDCTFSPTQTTSGSEIPKGATFRITRSGYRIETFLNGARDCLIDAAFDGPVIVSLVLLGPGLEAGMASVAFDNFVINSGTLLDPILVCPPPKTCTPPPPDLVSWWPGDGNTDDIADSNHGMLEGGATFAVGQVEQAFLLDGIDDFVDLGNASNLHVSAGDFTVDAWVLFNALSHPPGLNIGAPQGDMSIVDKMSASDVNTDGWRLIKQDDNRFWFCLGGGAFGNQCFDPAYTVFSTTQAVTGVWFHVAAVKSSSSFAIYVNGVLEDIRSPVPSFLDTNSTNLRVGSYALEGSHLNGLVDEVEIYSQALSGDEIRAIFEAGSAGKCKVTTVTIDIKPGSDPNSINPKSKGVIPVAILTTRDFDATTVDPLSVEFGPNRAFEAHGKGHIEDANKDGKKDLVLHFRTQDTGIRCGDTTASLTGATFDGDPIQGFDSIKTVGCKGVGKY